MATPIVSAIHKVVRFSVRKVRPKKEWGNSPPETLDGHHKVILKTCRLTWISSRIAHNPSVLESVVDGGMAVTMDP